MTIIFSNGDFWIDSIQQPRNSIPFGTRSIFNINLTRTGRFVGVSCTLDSAGSFTDTQVSINIHNIIGGAVLTYGQVISDFQIAINNHGTVNASAGANILFFMRK